MESFETKAFLLRRNWYVPVGCVAVAVASAIVSSVSRDLQPLGWFGVFCGTVFAAMTAWRDAFPLETQVRVQATPEAVVFAGRAPIPNGAIVEARLVPRPSRRDANTLVELVTRSRRKVRMLMPHDAAVDLLEIIGERRRSFTLAIPFWQRLLGTLFFIGVPWVAAVGPTMPSGLVLVVLFPFAILPVCMLVAWAVLGLLRGTLVIGADGFTTRWLRRERFVSFRDVEQIVGHFPWTGGARDTIVALRSGKEMRLRAFDRPNTEAERGAEGNALFGHMVEAHKRSVALGAGLEARALLSRGQRSPREWREGIDAMLRGGGANYRVAAVGPEVLADIVKDANGAPEARAGAAAALLRSGVDASRTTVRVAADACAEPGLRVALLELADAADDTAVERALARVATRARS